MKLLNLDGKEFVVRLDLENSKRDNKSDLHLKARKLIHDEFRPVIIVEEVYIPINNGMYLDFFIPLYKICFEVHGEQHYEYNSFFFKSKIDFLKAKRRDKIKKEWCDFNNIRIVELSCKEKEDEWRRKISGSRT